MLSLLNKWQGVFFVIGLQLDSTWTHECSLRTSTRLIQLRQEIRSYLDVVIRDARWCGGAPVDCQLITKMHSNAKCKGGQGTVPRRGPSKGERSLSVSVWHRGTERNCSKWQQQRELTIQRPAYIPSIAHSISLVSLFPTIPSWIPLKRWKHHPTGFNTWHKVKIKVAAYFFHCPTS